MQDSPPTISTPVQVRALAVPARQEVVDALETAGPCAVADLAAALGRPADGLYHHLRVLERVKLIRVVERRKIGRRAYVVYDVAVRPLVMSYDRPVRPRDVVNVVAALQRIALRDFRRALAGDDPGPTRGPTRGPDRTVWGARARAWLTPDEIRRLNRLLAEAMALVRAGRSPAPPAPPAPAPGQAPAADDRRCISLQFVLTPSGSAVRRKARTPTRTPTPTPTRTPRSGGSR